MVVRAAAWDASRVVFVNLFQSGKSKVVTDAARIPALTLAVGAQSFVRVMVCSLAAISILLRGVRDYISKKSTTSYYPIVYVRKQLFISAELRPRSLLEPWDVARW